jgi:tripartite ATP-independent transporter DctP family solute receptor
LFPSAQLGGSREMVEGMQVGTVEMAMPTAAVTSRVVKELEVLDLPFLFRDFAHLHAYLDGPGGVEMRAAALRRGIRIFGFYTGGTRGVYARKPLRGMEDLKGLKVRTLEAPIVTATWRALGAIPTPIPFPEVYSALQAGVVDAGEGNIVTYRTSKLDEVAPHVLHIRYLITVVLVAIAEPRWQVLPADLRGPLEQAFRESMVFERKINEEEEGRNLSELQAKGRTVVVPEDLGPYQKAVQAVYEQYGKGIGSEKIRQIQALR